MRLEDIESMGVEFLDVQTVADYLGMGNQPQPLREAIRKGVPWGYVIGKAKFVIPRRAFVSYHKKGAVAKGSDNA